MRQRIATRMRLLFDSFCVLSGDLFDESQQRAKRASSRARCIRSEASLSVAGNIEAFAAASKHGGAAASTQAQLVAALEELHLQHSGANFRRFVQAFNALEQECSEALATLQDRSQM